MRILGVDPGTATTGIGVIDEISGNVKAVDHGCIITPSDWSLDKRLKSIYDSINDIITQYNPEVLAIEELFFNKNVRTALAVGHARGVVILAAANRGIEIFQYTPLQVKQAVAGYGQAQKMQVQNMVKILLNLEKRPSPDDAADALAVALCHSFSYRYANILNKNRERISE